MLAAQGGERQVGAEGLTAADLDAAEGQQPVDLALGEARHLVRGDAVFVEAARLVARLVDRHAVPGARQGVGAGQSCRPRPDHGHVATALGRALEQRRVGLEHPVGGMALQRADGHRLGGILVPHAGAFTEDFRGAHARAHPAQGIGIEDLVRRAAQVVRGDGADEARDVDAGGAGLDAGRVVAEVAALRGEQGRLAVQRRRDVLEVPRQRVRAQAAGGDVAQFFAWHSISPSCRRW